MANLRDTVIAFHRDGRTAVEIVSLAPHLSSAHELGAAWNTINQRLVNRWIRKAREEDPDLVIWHHLNQRKRKPDLYTNWKRDGFILLSPYYDQLTDTLYLGTGMDYIPIAGSRAPGNVIRYEEKKKASGYRRRSHGMRDSDAVGQYVAELHDAFGYSSRDIVKLWEKTKTRHPATDREPRVVWLSEQLRGVRVKVMGHTTINRILKKYGYIKRPNLESGEQGDV